MSYILERLTQGPLIVRGLDLVVCGRANLLLYIFKKIFSKPTAKLEAVLFKTYIIRPVIEYFSSVLPSVMINFVWIA